MVLSLFLLVSFTVFFAESDASSSVIDLHLEYITPVVKKKLDECEFRAFGQGKSIANLETITDPASGSIPGPEPVPVPPVPSIKACKEWQQVKIEQGPLPSTIKATLPFRYGRNEMGYGSPKEVILMENQLYQDGIKNIQIHFHASYTNGGMKDLGSAGPLWIGRLYENISLLSTDQLPGFVKNSTTEGDPEFLFIALDTLGANVNLRAKTSVLCWKVNDEMKTGCFIDSMANVTEIQNFNQDFSFTFSQDPFTKIQIYFDPNALNIEITLADDFVCPVLCSKQVDHIHLVMYDSSKYASDNVLDINDKIKPVIFHEARPFECNNFAAGTDRLAKFSFNIKSYKSVQQFVEQAGLLSNEVLVRGGPELGMDKYTSFYPSDRRQIALAVSFCQSKNGGDHNTCTEYLTHNFSVKNQKPNVLIP